MAKDTPATIRKLALRYPETSAAPSCNKTAIKARTKSFVFVGETPTGWNLMVKLEDSLGELEEFAAQEPERYIAGKGGWTTLRFPNGEAPPAGVLPRWIDESFRLLAPKTLVKTLPPAGPPA